MEGFLWLLLQTLPLLTAATVVFFILGWRWRGHLGQRDLHAQTRQTDAENMDAHSARQERDTSRALEEKLREKLTATQGELQEANDRQTQLQKEILRLSDLVKSGQGNLSAPPPQGEGIAKSLPPTPAIESSPAPVPAALPTAKKAKGKSSKSPSTPKSKKNRPPKPGS